MQAVAVTVEAVPSVNKQRYGCTGVGVLEDYVRTSERMPLLLGRTGSSNAAAALKRRVRLAQTVCNVELPAVLLTHAPISTVAWLHLLLVVFVCMATDGAGCCWLLVRWCAKPEHHCCAVAAQALGSSAPPDGSSALSATCCEKRVCVSSCRQLLHGHCMSSAVACSLLVQALSVWAVQSRSVYTRVQGPGVGGDTGFSVWGACAFHGQCTSAPCVHQQRYLSPQPQSQACCCHGVLPAVPRT
jgi:hypothetical protein